ncbi:DUF6168 family protein [Lacinutrix chionoecetis]
MTKQISLYFFSFLALFGITYFSQRYVIDLLKIELSFSLFHIYIFHFFASLIICSVFLLLSKSEKWISQLGFLYLFALITKILFFAAAFKEHLFKTESFTKTESLNLLIPLFLFLTLEVYFIAKILNKK